MSIPLSDPGRTGPLGHLEIHLDRVRWNYLSLQKKLAKGADCAAVVKADAYGIGAAEVAVELYKANCRHFYAAHAGEGVAVRQALNGREAQVYVLHGPFGMKAEEFVRSNLIPVLNSWGDIEYWSGFARKTGQRLPAVIQIDTGMNRLGVTAEEVARLTADPEILKPLDVRYLLSHLACADEPAHPKNKEQLEAFRRLTAQLGLPSRLSFANSAGIFLGTDYHFDQVRPGAALYGINPSSVAPNLMQGIVTFKVRILQIKDVDRGETVGYGASYQVSTPAKLAILSVGYADGYMRSITGDGMVHVRGHACPVVGRISMDLIAADVTKVAPAPQAGEWAEIIGDHQTVDDVAAATKLIGYEILTNLGRRYKRIYSGQG
ncbi:MAG: alanine racemase [Alphaproteobacteria bacterium]|nr:alanine racemase [Alphaproteobacteria bacterium]